MKIKIISLLVLLISNFCFGRSIKISVITDLENKTQDISITDSLYSSKDVFTFKMNEDFIFRKDNEIEQKRLHSQLLEIFNDQPVIKRYDSNGWNWVQAMKEIKDFAVFGNYQITFLQDRNSGNVSLQELYLYKQDKEIKETKPTFAYVTNGVDPFWNLCAGGVKIATEEFGIQCDVLMPPKGLIDQKRMMQTLIENGVNGIAVSPVDADNQTLFLNEIANDSILITHDSDAPKSDRLVYIGTNNYKAGRALGGLVKKAIPEGGEVMLFVGRLEQLNARQRRQGVIDELLDRPLKILEQVKYDSVSTTNLTSVDLKYTILDTRTDNFDRARAKSNAEEAIAKYKNLKCMVGLFAYNSPSCIDAIKEANKLGSIKVCGFDEQDALLHAIEDGHAYGTISQQPWEYGYESVKVLFNIYKGKKPTTPFHEVPFAEVTQKNIREFWGKKKTMAELGATR